MASTSPADSVKHIGYLAAALKAPRITEAAQRLADQAATPDGLSRTTWLPCSNARSPPATHPVPNCGPAQPRSLHARPSRTSTRTQPAARQQIAALASGAFLTEARNVVLLGPPGTGKTTWPSRSGSGAWHGHRVQFATATDWVTRLTDPHRQTRLPREPARLRRYGLIIVNLCRPRDYAEGLCRPALTT